MRHAVFAVELLNSLTYFSYASSLERGLADDVSSRLQRALTDSGWLEDTNGGLWGAASDNAVTTRRNLLFAQRLDKLQTPIGEPARQGQTTTSSHRKVHPRPQHSRRRFRGVG